MVQLNVGYTPPGVTFKGNLLNRKPSVNVADVPSAVRRRFQEFTGERLSEDVDKNRRLVAAATAQKAAAARRAAARQAANVRDENIERLEGYAANADEATSESIRAAIEAGDLGRGFEIAREDVQNDFVADTGSEWVDDPSERQRIVEQRNAEVAQHNTQVAADFTADTGSEWVDDPSERQRIVEQRNAEVAQHNTQVAADFAADTGAEWTDDPDERRRIVEQKNAEVGQHNAQVEADFTAYTGAEWVDDEAERQRIIQEATARREAAEPATTAPEATEPDATSTTAPEATEPDATSTPRTFSDTPPPSEQEGHVAGDTQEQQTGTPGYLSGAARDGFQDAVEAVSEPAEESTPAAEPDQPFFSTEPMEERTEPGSSGSIAQVSNEGLGTPESPDYVSGAASPADQSRPVDPTVLRSVYAEDLEARDDAIRSDIRGALASGNHNRAHNLAQYLAFDNREGGGNFEGLTREESRQIIGYREQVLAPNDQALAALDVLGGRVAGQLIKRFARPVVTKVRGLRGRPVGSSDPVGDAALQARRIEVAESYLKGSYTSEAARAGLVTGATGAGVRPPATTVIATTRGSFWTPPPVQDGPWAYLRNAGPGPDDLLTRAGGQTASPAVGPGGVSVATRPATSQGGAVAGARASVQAINEHRAAQALREAADQQAIASRRQVSNVLDDITVRRQREALAAADVAPAAGTSSQGAFVPTSSGLVVPAAADVAPDPTTVSGAYHTRPSGMVVPDTVPAQDPDTSYYTQFERSPAARAEIERRERAATGTETATRDLPGTAPATRDLPGTAPATKDVTGTETATRDLPGTEPATKDVTGTETATRDLPGTEPATKDVTGTETATRDLPGTEPATKDLTGTESATQADPFTAGQLRDRLALADQRQLVTAGELRGRIDLAAAPEQAFDQRQLPVIASFPAVEASAAPPAAPPGVTLQAAPEGSRGPRPRRSRPRVPGQAAPEDAEAAQVQGPPDGYARRIQHTERVEYSYDPGSGQYSARLVESSEPQVLARDDSPPQPIERAVGGFDITPHGRDIRAVPREDQDLEVPPGVQARLKAQAERDGGPATRTENLTYIHDVDTQETDQRVERSQADRARTVAAAVAGGARTAAARASTASERAQTYVRRAAAGAVDATGSAVGQYEAGRAASQEERATAERRQGQAQAEYQAALQHYEDVQKQAGASGRLHSLAGRIRGDEEPDELREARQRVQEAAQNVREAQKTERASLGGVGSAGRLIERAERGGRGAYAKGRQLAVSDRAQRFVKMLLAQEAAQKPKGGTKKRRSSATKTKERKPPYQQPTIIVIRESGSGSGGKKRYGRL